ncbi:hypothetical protein [Vibrio vulnificus]|uniref:hypothetical protein n=1 Tax=Vibrio vulnificus TaxID=672 RepID=UPI000D73A8C8|nr:hypothetical protein [Vibrio vulnificus]PWY32287.1 hypothetical protein VV86_17480 [Vibrio vulnificus]
MIVNYESAVKAVEDGIKEYTSSPDYKGNTLWENIVCGMHRTLYILEDVKRNSSYSKALSGLDRDDLRNIKNCIDGKIRDIEKEEKVKLYRLSVDGICYYYSTAKAAKEGLFKEFDDWIDDDFDELNVEIDPIYIAVSERSSYQIIK